MATEFKLPELGENIESGDLVRLLIKPGASIAEGQTVMELETDKAVVEVPSSVAGTVGEVRVKEGEKLRVGQVIFTVENGAGPAKAVPASSSAANTTTPAAPPSKPQSSLANIAAAEPVSSSSKSSSLPAATSQTSTAGASAGEFTLPELGENIDSGDLVRLMILPGTRFS